MAVLMLWPAVSNIFRQASAEDKDAKEKNRLAEVERKRQAERDLDTHFGPVMYEVGRHANETLALRYGIANVKNSKDTSGKSKIYLRKIKGLDTEPNAFLVELTDFRNRRAIAIHEQGKPYIPTFFPLDVTTEDVDKSWFKRNRELELVLKGNSTMSIKEIAKFHIEKTVGANTG